jgi:hypothetical protein
VLSCVERERRDGVLSNSNEQQTGFVTKLDGMLENEI